MGARRPARYSVRAASSAALLAVVLMPGRGHAQLPGPAGLQIQHDPVSCLEAGKFPRLIACFVPVAELARSRVYFRAHGTRDWYSVTMTPEETCFVGVLPKPKKDIGGVDYYVEATGRDFTEILTPEYDPIVVEDESECDGFLAPFLDKAEVLVASATGASIVPQGFAAAGVAGAGIPAGLVIGVVGAGVAGTTAAVVTGGGGESGPSPTSTTRPSPPPTPSPSPEPTPTPTPVPTTTTTTTTTLAANGPPTLRVNAAPEQGDSPHRVTFNMCATKDPDEDPLEFSIVFGDGATYRGTECNVKHDYTAPVGVTREYHPVVCVTDGQPGHEVCDDTITITVQGPSGDLPSADLSSPRHLPTPAPPVDPPGSSSGVDLGSDLTVPGGTGQIILNGAEALFVGSGLAQRTAQGRPGANRVEAVLVDGAGPGEWRFTVSSVNQTLSELRIVAGQAARFSPREVVFSLDGRAGERVVFSFRLAPAP